MICGTAVTKKNDMWNSFNDISRALQIGRNKVIAVINELVGMGFIRKLRVLKKDGSYSDNHYSVADQTSAKEETAKKEESPEQAATAFGTFKNNLHIDYILPVAACQAVKQDFFYFQTGVVP